MYIWKCLYIGNFYSCDLYMSTNQKFLYVHCQLYDLICNIFVKRVSVLNICAIFA